MKRQAMSNGASRALFERTTARVHPLNLNRTATMRGGIRL